MDHSMSYEQFLRCVGEFLELSNEIKDGWTLEGCLENVGHGYIKKCNRVVDSKNLKPPVSVVQGMEVHSDAAFCDECEVPECPSEAELTWEYHVLYSSSYGVPELFFNVWNEDGALLALDDVWSKVPARFSGTLQQNKWNFITQQEHPICRRPFFHLHPCQTPDILRSLCPSRNLLVSWLSTVGCAVGLNIDLRYASLT